MPEPAMRFRVGHHSPINVWLESDGEPDVQWAMATDPQRAATLVRLANAGLDAEPKETR